GTITSLSFVIKVVPQETTMSKRGYCSGSTTQFITVKTTSPPGHSLIFICFLLISDLPDSIDCCCTPFIMIYRRGHRASRAALFDNMDSLEESGLRASSSYWNVGFVVVIVLASLPSLLLFFFSATRAMLMQLSI
ncbi:hypothetical protein Pfo_026385, partial [Paulownia fortunei]